MNDAAHILLGGLHVAALVVGIIVAAAALEVGLEDLLSRFYTWRGKRRRNRRPGYITGGPR